MAVKVRKFRGSGMLLLMAILAGSAGAQPVATRDSGQRLRERAGEYWDARIRGDLLATYTLHEPAFRRAVTLTAFLQGRGMTRVVEYAILGERLEGDLGIVKVKVKSAVIHPKMAKPDEPKWYEAEEQWVRIDGEWYRKFRFPMGDPYPPVNWDDVAPGG